MGTLLLVFALVLYVVSETSIQHANPGRKVSHWFGADLEPMRDKIVRAVGIGLAVMGAFQLSETIGYWGFLLGLAVATVPVFMRLRHNMSVKRAWSGATNSNGHA